MSKLKKNLNQYKVILTFFTAYLTLCLSYRALFFVNLAQEPLYPLYTQFIIISLGLMSDFVVVILTTFILFCLQYSATKLIRSNLPQYFFTILISGIFLLLACLLVINQKIFSTLYIGMNYTLLYVYLNIHHYGFDLFSFINQADILFVLSLMAMYVGLQFLSVNRLLQIACYLLLPIYFLLTWYSSQAIGNANIVNKRMLAIYANPMQAIWVTFLQSFNQYNNKKIVMSEAQAHSVQLIDKTFLTYPLPLPTTKQSSIKGVQANWNIVVFVLESVGSNYLFNKVNNKIPMPFLQQLTKQSMWYTNNYSGGNLSAYGQFSIFTGLYPDPNPSHFEFQEKMVIPSIVNWLGKHYDSFLVSTSNDLYFAMGVNRTFAEYDNAKMISPDDKDLYFNMFLDENKGFNFFLNRLQHAKSPFIGVYWSGAAHYPYKDYPNQRYLFKNSSVPLARYLNNLYILDQEIKQTYELLMQKNWLKNTIFIVVGDHGEMFNEHQNFSAHGQSLYQEEIKVPLLIFAPKLFKPHTFNHVTSSVDILPTLLQALKIDYGMKLQGESLLNVNPARDYVFIYGDQDDIAAIDQNQIKMQISFAAANCRMYNLNNDPHEQSPLPCTRQKQQDAILKFRNFQAKILADYGKQ